MRAISLDPILQSASHDRWLEAALADPATLLDDHCQCELKAATNALALVGRHPEKDALVRAMTALAAEEMRHYRLVRRVLRARGGQPGRPLASPYLKGLSAARRGGPEALLDELLIAAVVEARSCERFHRLEEGLTAAGDSALAALYRRLIRSEEGHARLFVEIAMRHFPAERVLSELERHLAHEAAVLDRSPVSARMHGGHAAG